VKLLVELGADSAATASSSLQEEESNMVNGSRWMVRRRILILVLSIVILSLFSSALVAKFGSPLRCEFFSLCNKNFPSLSSIPPLLRVLPNKDHHHLAGPEEEEELPPPPPELAPADDLPQSVVLLDPPLQYYTSDDELTAHVLAQDILSRPTLSLSVEQAKVAFMFMTPGALPFEAIWEKFFEGHEGKYSVYVHASEKASLGSIWKSKVFKGREIRSEKVCTQGFFFFSLLNFPLVFRMPPRQVEVTSNCVLTTKPNQKVNFVSSPAGAAMSPDFEDV
jgi:hypothetical protein